MGNAGAFLGIDLGGSSCKAVVVSVSGQVVSGRSVPYPTRRRRGDEVTQRPSDWENAMALAVRSCLERAPELEVIGLAVTAPAHAVALVGEDGRSLAPTLMAQDARPDEVARRLAQDHGEEIFRKTMVPLSGGWSLAQLSWIAQMHPELAGRARWVLPIKDYLRFRLTGQAACDPSDAAGTALYDPVSGEWDDEICSLSGFATSSFPPVLASTAIGGRLSRSWAKRTGLKVGTPVAVGATDTAAELVSIGAREAGTGMAKIGSTGAAVGVSSLPRPSRGTYTYPYLDSGKWYSVAVTSTAGTAYEWLCAVLGSSAGEADRRASEMDRLARNVVPGCEGLLFFPYLEGERSPYWLRDLRGAFVGLASSHSTGDLCRAVLEGVAMSVGDCFKVLENLGVAPAAPVLTGGGSESELWRRILAAVLGVRCDRVTPHGPGIGAAIIAAEAVTGRALTVKARRQSIRVPENWTEIYKQQLSSYNRISRELVALRSEVRAPDLG